MGSRDRLPCVVAVLVSPRPLEECEGYPAGGSPNQELPQSVVTVPSTLSQCLMVA